ncbi:MAG TPA: N-(5'-phosphoribosyl)anthranilate isomerase [Flavobacterium sp.]|nr:N-(5'-phosphoribosyl)anthranilate isomerase [Flavobacterium sp.]
MNPVKIKICGMKYPQNIVDIASLKPDYMGFIFWDKSLRKYKLKHMPQVQDRIKKTGVFVNPTYTEVVEILKKNKLDAIQLHGSESVEFCDQLQTTNTEIIKAFSIDASFDFSDLEKYESVTDYFLFDTKGKLPGGNGITFDWQILENYNSTKPFFLSGGIGLNEITEIKKFLQSKASKYCYALDLNSKFEIKPGLKDKIELEKFKKLLYEC